MSPDDGAVPGLDGSVVAPGHPPGRLAERCGALLPAGTHRHDRPPPGAPGELCRVIFVADLTRPGRSPVEHSPRHAPGDRPVPPIEGTEVVER